MADLLCVAPDLAVRVWPHVAHWIKAAMVRGDLGRFNDVQDAVMRGRALLWVVADNQIRAAVVTEISHTERSKVLVIVAYGGGRFIELLPKLEDYARNEGCDCVRIFGRKGWARLLKDYSAPKILLEKRLR